MGVTIPYATEFNDETGEVKFFMRGINQDGCGQIVRSGESLESGLEFITCTATIKGAKMVARTEKETTL
jgi:hypothetical protein